MAIEVKAMKRIFVFEKSKDEKIDLPEIDETMTPEEHRKFYAGIHPELAMAVIGTPKLNQKGEQIYTMSSKPGERS